MKLPSESRFQRWKYLELARWRQDQHGDYKVLRENTGPMNKRTALVIEWAEVDKYRDKFNNLGIYTSVFQYDNLDLNEATRLGSLYFDLDNKENPTIALQEGRRLYEYLAAHIPKSALRFYFTGEKGFHIECEAIALGIGPTNDLPGLFRYIANNIKDELQIGSFDFAVYDLRRMWRLPNSQHQITHLYKVELDEENIYSPLETIKSYAKEPRWTEVPDQSFNVKANEWYREWIYKKEVKTYSTDEMIERFKRFGTGVSRELGSDKLQFNPLCFTQCHALNDLWRKAERDHDLSHEERLFLCSILTYTEEAQEYLHAILRNCDDYNESKSQAHINDWIRRRELGIGGRPYSCERANSAGVGCGDCHLESRKKWEVIGDRMVETGEQAAPSPIRFVYERRKLR